MYTVVDAALVRAATQTPSWEAVPWPDLTGTTGELAGPWRLWLQRVWALDGFAAAVEVASPVLAGRVREICQGRQLNLRQVRRVVLSVMRYLLRANGRATPFGLFAGVAPARLGGPPAARFGESHHAVARIDAEWLGGVITLLEGCSELRRRLAVVGNNLALIRDARLVVACQQLASAAGGFGPAEVSVRNTPAVAAIMRATRVPVLLGELSDTLAADFPSLPVPVIEWMLAELVRRRVLVTSLHPPTTATDPLAHVLDALTEAGAGDVPEVASLLVELREIQTGLTRHNHETAPAGGRDLRASLAERIAAVHRVERPVMVDLRLDGELALPADIVREAEAAAAVLVRLAPHPGGTPTWRDYHHRFVERYGMGACVSIVELLDADIGLGYPAGYRGSRRKPPAPPGLSERDLALLALAQRAAMQHTTEIVLDDQMIADLAVQDVAILRVQPHTELAFRIHARTLDALGRGEFELAVTGVARAAGTMTGRFLDLLNTDDRDRMLGAYTNLPTISTNALPVQLSCPALFARADNVGRSPAVLAHRLALAEHHPHGEPVIPLDDIAVSGDAQRLYLLSISRRALLEPTIFSAVELARQALPLARFLCEVNMAGATACTPFSWGAAHRLPFLPRIRYRRTILAPARWVVSAADLPGPTAPWRDWADGVAAWRRHWRVPPVVFLGPDDRRIRLDLDEPAHLHLLRADLHHGGPATLREAPEAAAFGWFGGRAHEVVLPLAATGRPLAQRTWTGHAIGREHAHLPAISDWLYVKLYGHPDRHNVILTTHLPTLLSTWDRQPQWWFLRYHDPEPHLRLRIRLRDADEFGLVATRVSAWAADLRRRGLVGQIQYDTYHPETGRFGPGEAMAAAETVFATDSAAAVAQLATASHRDGTHPQAIIAASMVNLTLGLTHDIAAGMRWLIDHATTASTPAPAPARPVHEQAVRLANPHGDWAAVRATPGGDRIMASWQRRCHALAGYRATLTVAQVSPDSLLPDLLHLHHVRMAGISPDSERVCLRLARAAALRWTAQAEGAR